ncbi:carbohydrate ABC transporter permease [bacterium]|nr:carbohydrate ABC transporter permease [bacterium]
MKSTTFVFRFEKLALTVLAAGLAALFLLPLLWMLGSALRPSEDIFRYLSPFSVRAFVPTEYTLKNFDQLLSGSFPEAVLNSLIVAGSTVLIGLLLSASAAFGLSALEFPGRELLFSVVVISFLIPFEGVAIPLSDLFRIWGLENSYPGLVLPGVANGLAIFLLRQFFLGIPRDLKDAARVDGASWWRIFWGIYVPLSRPALIGAGLILFIWQWQAYLWPLIIISDPALDVAPVALAKFLGQFDFNFGQMFAGSVIIALIPMLILLPLQRYFTQSISVSGLKE